MMLLSQGSFFINYKFIIIFISVILVQLRQISPKICRTGKEKYKY